MTDSPFLMNESVHYCDTQDNVLHDFDPSKDTTQYGNLQQIIDFHESGVLQNLQRDSGRIILQCDDYIN